MQGRRGRAAPRRGPGIADTPTTGPAAILVAGGRGQRASVSPRQVAKQFRPLAGKRVFEWSLDTLLSFGCDPVVCVFPREHLESAESIARRDRVLTTGGGSSRQASVAAGLELVDAPTVIVHDAARPLVTEAMLAAVMAPLSDLDGAITALRMNETIKRTGDDLVIETVDRSDLWRSQTPQAFRTEALKQAHKK
ncbi:MAG: 2-C-methyl-D-erythritol 4-phosphate cytidylyltransferase, partial [Actinomycetota bacterium]